MGTSATNYTARPTERTSRRHIGLFVRSFGGGGGAERVMLNLATDLADRGHRVDLVMGRKEGHFLEEIPDTVTVIDLKVRSARQLLPQLLPTVLKMPRVARRAGRPPVRFQTALDSGRRSRSGRVSEPPAAGSPCCPLSAIPILRRFWPDG